MIEVGNRAGVVVFISLQFAMMKMKDTMRWYKFAANREAKV